MTLVEAREAVAAALCAVSGYTVRPRPFRAAPKPGDGWVTVSRLAPADFTRSSATLMAAIVLGPDLERAEELLDLDGLDLLNAVTAAEDFNATDVSLEPADILTSSSSSTPLYGAMLTLTLEVD